MIIFDFEIFITKNVFCILALSSIIHAICTVVLCREGPLVLYSSCLCAQYYMQVSDKLYASTAFTPRNGMSFFMLHKTFQNFSE